MGPNVTIYDVPSNASIERYREAKIEILRRDFKITLTDEEAERVNDLKTEAQVNQFCLGVIDRHWAKEGR